MSEMPFSNREIRQALHKVLQEHGIRPDPIDCEIIGSTVTDTPLIRIEIDGFFDLEADED